MVICMLIQLSAVPGFNQVKPIIGVAGISHESNSFNIDKTGLEDFKVRIGKNIKERSDRFFASRTSKTIIAGYIEGARLFGMDLFPTIVTGATPKGPVTDQAFDAMMKDIRSDLTSGLKLQGILLNLHGAMIAESYPSGDEEIVRRVRETFGKEMPIVVTHDFHANITPKMIEHSTVLITFKKNPHLDTYERGLQAAEIMSKIVLGEVKPVKSIVKTPMVYNIAFQTRSRNRYCHLLTIAQASLFHLPVSVKKIIAELRNFAPQTFPLVKQSLKFYSVITHGKCFLEAKGRGVSLNRKEALKLATTDQAAVHDQILHLRNQYIAHSGEGGYEHDLVVAALNHNELETKVIEIYDNLMVLVDIDTHLEIFDSVVDKVYQYVNDVTLKLKQRMLADLLKEDISISYANSMDYSQQ